LQPSKTASNVACLLARALFSRKMKSMRIKIRESRNSALGAGISPARLRHAGGVVAEQMRFNLETATLRSEKFLILTGTSTAFFSGSGTLQGCKLKTNYRNVPGVLRKYA
jgi:hypothetical protein